MRNPENIKQLASLPIDYIGFIFYEKSARYVSEKIEVAIPETIQRVGVFVDASESYIQDKICTYKLDAIQLHGNELPEFCRLFPNITVIKAINICSPQDFQLADSYQDSCDMLLFDTKTALHGGSGQKFDWNLLSHYKGEKPFLLSGGIGLEDLEVLKNLYHPKLVGIDLNSKFEDEPGMKNIEKIKVIILS